MTITIYIPPKTKGLAFEDQIFKERALYVPYAKLITMARVPLAVAMVGKTIGKRMAEKLRGKGLR